MGHNEPLRLMFQTLSVTGIAQQLFGLGAQSPEDANNAGSFLLPLTCHGTFIQL